MCVVGQNAPGWRAATHHPLGPLVSVEDTRGSSPSTSMIQGRLPTSTVRTVRTELGAARSACVRTAYRMAVLHEITMSMKKKRLDY